MSYRRPPLFAIVWTLTFSCSPNTTNFATLDSVPLELKCSFAEKTQIFETSVLFEEDQLKGSLTVFDVRHKLFVEKITVSVAHENEFWILRSTDKSDSVTTLREHRINEATLTYERKSFVQMGNTPPITISNRGQCVRI